MCQLFALNSNAPTAVTFSFTGFSARGGLTGHHADGFGLAFHEDAACRSFIDPGAASDSPLAEFLRQHPIRSRMTLAHVRKATQGEVSLSNCHPFVREWRGRHWSFCHNGDLKAFTPPLRGAYTPVGTTDSERAFCWILQQFARRLRGRSAPDWQVIAPLLAEIVEPIARHGRFNMLMSDGRALYAHCSTQLVWLRREHPFATAHLVDHDMSLDLSLANHPGDRMALVATEPLTRNEDWVAFAPGESRVFVQGASVWSHGAVEREASALPKPVDRAAVPAGSRAAPRPTSWAAAAA